MDFGKNALQNQGSPYLKEHSEDLVYWQPWCIEAFEKAKTLDRPVFLSIGYKSCHWCKVLQEEPIADMCAFCSTQLCQTCRPKGEDRKCPVCEGDFLANGKDAPVIGELSGAPVE